MRQITRRAFLGTGALTGLSTVLPPLPAQAAIQTIYWDKAKRRWPAKPSTANVKFDSMDDRHAPAPKDPKLADGDLWYKRK